MSAAIVVSGLLEGLQLIENLASALSTVSGAVKAAQSSGTPLDLSATGPILSAEATAENAVLAAIAAAQAAGK